MAEPGCTRDIQNVKLQQISSSKGRSVNYIEGQLLSLSEITVILDKNKSKLNESGLVMINTLKKVKSHHFQHMQVSLPITNLQHVTGWDCMHEIYKQGGFISTQDGIRPGFNELSFWSPAVSSKVIQTARQEAYDAVREVITPAYAEGYQREIKEQFANSPAFSTTSRFGNFRFSFPLSDLLSLYKSQHCGDGEPQLRILGTDIYKQEIAHYIVVHGPDTDQFSDLPMVPSVTSSSGSVYMMDGTLFWRPESTSNALKVKIYENGSVLKECYLPCDWFISSGHCCHINDGIYSVWNHLVLAFHLPKDHHLKIPQQNLLENLTPCDADYPFLRDEDPLSIHNAQQMINNLKGTPNSH